jgi:hypothetical protein
MAQAALTHTGSSDLDRLLALARAVVTHHWPRIETIAAALLKFQWLDYDKLRRLSRRRLRVQPAERDRLSS